ncbi:hypothetical protein QAD02_009758 [Eretmocerus hayati]|uniref:Uncharacterized protein n=1 Tax=Eretmocerus hayati TaxID=131215 RepID=A0ACC2NA89_9HYME|nr:hypothetical protein QAD02_009758 [Eretmocerus hayati]
MAAAAVTALTLYLLTWNVHQQQPIKNLDSLLNLEKLNSTGQLPDLYVIGLEEIDSSGVCGFGKIIPNIFCQAHDWQYELDDTLKKFGYMKLSFKRLHGIVLGIFSMKKDCKLYQNVKTDVEATGGFNWGNKGAVSTRFNIHGTNICFVNSHLKPGDGKLQERILNYNEIIEEISFDVPGYENILSHDYVFWMGDLNVRLDANLDTEKIKQYVRDGRLNDLLEQDELIKSIRDKKIFIDFEEHPITFPPTYKYLQGSQQFVTDRRPAWTDRILYRIKNKTDSEQNFYKIESRDYTSHPEYDVSDHKPVSGIFEIVVRNQNPDAA